MAYLELSGEDLAGVGVEQPSEERVDLLHVAVVRLARHLLARVAQQEAADLKFEFEPKSQKGR